MTFLKKLGTILANVAGIAVGIGPLIKPFVGSGKAGSILESATNDLVAVGQIVVQTEAILQTPGSGATKLAAAAPLVAGIVKTSELVAGKKIANEALFIEGCTDITSGVAKVLNSIHPDAAS